jgi:hypothetical protein
MKGAKLESLQVQGVEHLQEINQTSLVDVEAEVFEGNAPVADRQNLL